MQIKKSILFAVLLLITPSIIKASSTISVNCPEKVKENESFTCSIKGNFDKNVNNVIVKYRYSNELIYQSIELKDTWNFMLQDNPSNTKFCLENDLELIGESNLADITFKVASGSANKNLYIEFYDFDATNSSNQIINYSNDPVKKIINVMSNNNNLKTLTIDGQNIGLTENTNYSYNTNKNSITITAELDDTDATCENLTRTVNLVNGNNIITYNVVAEDGSTKRYTINITYVEPKESEVKPNPNTNQTNNGTINNNNLDSTTNTNNISSDDNSNNNNSNNIIENNQIDEKNNEETSIEKNNSKEQTEKVKENKDKEKKTQDIEKTEIKSTDKKKTKIYVVLIIISIVIISLSIIIVKKNWGTLYKN